MVQVKYKVIDTFDPNRDYGLDQMIKSEIKLLAVEIDLDLDQHNTIPKTNSSNQIETIHKHKWTRGEKIAIMGVCVAILGIAVAIFA